jgi:hypothetical protein
MLAIGCLAGPADAAIFTYTATGVIDSATGDISPIAASDTFTARWSVDSTVPAESGSTPNQAVFDALTGLSVAIGTYSAAATGPLEIQVDSNLASFPDRYGVVPTTPDVPVGPINGHTLSLLFIDLNDSTKSVFGDATILPTQLNLASFDSTELFLSFDDGSIITGHITGLSQTPLPAALPLFAGGLGVLGLLGWRRKRKAAAVAA